LRAQQGITIDYAAIDEVLARYKGIDSFHQWYNSMLPQEIPPVDYKMMPRGQQGGMTESTQAAKTQNFYQQQARASERPSPNQQTGMSNE